MPEEVKEFRMKKKTLRSETKYFDEDNPFKQVDE
jgi:hypothetical protein